MESQNQPTDDKNPEKEALWQILIGRYRVLHYFLVVALGAGSVWTTNALTQQALANKIQNLEEADTRIIKTVEEKQHLTAEQVNEIKAELKQAVVTKEVLDLRLKPITDELLYQRGLQERTLAALQGRPWPTNP